MDGKAAHKRRIALLAILAVARGRTVGRERIIGLLWADHRTSAARHLLSESLYVLRKELGADAFVSAGDEVGLNGAVVGSDVEEFEREAEQGGLERAAQIYRGPFMDGFFVSGAAEFEQWAEAERARLARVHSRVLECLADACESAGRHGEAAEWWRRLSVQDPSSTRVGMRLMTALEASGERAAALWFALSHVAYLQAELGVEPQDEFLDLVERLKKEPVPLPTRTGAVAAPTPQAPAQVPTPESPPPVPAENEQDAGPAEDSVAPAAESLGGGEERANGAEGEDEASAAPPPGAAEPRGQPQDGRRRRRTLWVGAAAGVLMGLALAAVQPGEEAPPAPGRYDPRRVAVLYFEDDSRGGELGYLAGGLTESLIQTLSQVPALEVISRNGVKPYRQGAVPLARIVDDLQAGTVVEGSVQRWGDSVRVTAVLVDAVTQARVESRTVTHALGDVFALQDALADSVSVFLRRRVGAEVRLRGTAAETRSAAAWRSVQQARQMYDDAVSLQHAGGPTARESVLRLLADADSLLAAAERQDPRWTRPTVQRGWVALRRAPLVRETAASRAAALAHAERALARRPADPLARELRGSVFFALATSAVDSAGQAARVVAAERDLRAAVAADPALASGWSQLSRVVRYQGRADESLVLARRAFQQDAWLEDADVILGRLFFGAMFAADYPQARAFCDQGHRRFPTSSRFVECSLLLMRADPERVGGPAAVRALLAELDRLEPPEQARRAGRAYAPVFRLAVAAAALARAGQGDSARAMLARARQAARADPEMRVSLAYDEAIAYLLLGRPDTARALLEWSFTRRPAQRGFAARDPLLRTLAASPPADRRGRRAARASARPGS
ncbi:MAG TPA: BTAD domain-containing putative transcriptional regulator [Longimicrobium sp.]|uniref:BTAD domain-containing putative transcriptional regulator n=1 Tax=Longimicrobium sp. TaxID=2029185 RepID=UPI002ED9D567